MNQEEVRTYITQTYGAEAEFLWAKTPNAMVFRHDDNKKWFAAVLDVKRAKLGLSGDGVLFVLNVKCDPIMIGSFIHEPGFFPAYHMNKKNWLSIALDGSAEDEKIRMLLNVSYELTAKKWKRCKSAE